MECPNCHQPIETGAAFCGNCGRPVDAAAAIPASGVPGYALALPAQHAGETQALLSVLLGTAGLAGSLFVAVFGVFLGMLGIVMGTMSRSSPKRSLSTAGLVISGLSVLAGLGLIAYAVTHDPQLKTKLAAGPSSPAATSQAAGLSTPCYSVDFVDRLRISHAKDSCELQAFNGQSLAASSEIYKVYVTHSPVTAGGFGELAKSAIEKDIRTSLPGFKVDNETATDFAGSPAYVVNASSQADKVAVVEAAVFHQAPTGDNFFVLVHAANGASTDLQTMEAQWQWK